MDRNDLPIEAVKINGQYLEDVIPGYRTIITSGREAITPNLDTYSVGSSDGATIKGSRYPERKITVEFMLQGGSLEDFRKKMEQLSNLLSLEEADFVFNDESDRYYTGRALIDVKVKNFLNGGRGSYDIFCGYPFKRSTAVTVKSSADASGVVVENNSATFTFDYYGTYPARPMLRASFAAAKQNGDYSEDGDCGFIAFLDDEENIIQLGNPDVIDVDQYAKNGTLINSEFTALTAWNSENIAVSQITDTYWERGAGQTQKYAKPTADDASLYRTTDGAVDFEFDIVHRLCVSAAGQTGQFEALAKNDDDIVVGFRIEKAGNGTTGIVSYILNNKVVGTDSIDLSYYNYHFGYCNRTPVYTDEIYYVTVKKKVKKKKKKKKVKEARVRTVQSGWSYTQSNLNSGWTKDGPVVIFSVGNLPDRTFKSSDIANTPSLEVVFNMTGSFHTNCVHSCDMIRKAGVPFAEIPNVFTACDVVEADCNSADVVLYRAGSAEGHLEPQYGALGNDWEDFVLKPGRNIIKAVWSNWVNPNYKPLIQILYNEVFL